MVSEPHLRIYLAKSRFLSQVLNYQVAYHGSLWRIWLRGTSADEHRKCDEGLDGTFDLCHIFRREAPAPAMLHAFKLWVDPFTFFLSLNSPARLALVVSAVGPFRVSLVPCCFCGACHALTPRQTFQSLTGCGSDLVGFRHS